MKENKEYKPKITLKAERCIKCGGNGTIPVQRNLVFTQEPCPKCEGDGYKMVEKELR